MTGNELADWLINDQGCECEDAGKCNICLIAAKLRGLDQLAEALPPIDHVFLPSNPLKMRSVHVSVKQAVIDFRAALKRLGIKRTVD